MIQPAAQPASSILALVAGTQAAQADGTAEGAASVDFASLLTASLTSATNTPAIDATPVQAASDALLRQATGKAGGKDLPVALPETLSTVDAANLFTMATDEEAVPQTSTDETEVLPDPAIAMQQLAMVLPPSVSSPDVTPAPLWTTASGDHPPVDIRLSWNPYDTTWLRSLPILNDEAPVAAPTSVAETEQATDSPLATPAAQTLLVGTLVAETETPAITEAAAKAVEVATIETAQIAIVPAEEIAAETVKPVISLAKVTAQPATESVSPEPAADPTTDNAPAPAPALIADTTSSLRRRTATAADPVQPATTDMATAVAAPAATTATAPGDQIATDRPSQVAAELQPTIALRDAPAAAPTTAPATASTGVEPLHQRGHDFSVLVDRLIEAREAVVPQAVHAAVAHSDFGQVSLRFEQGADGLTVAMSSPDPDFANAVQASAPAGQSSSSTGDNGSAAPRQDGYGQQAAGSAPGQQNSQSSARNDRAGQSAADTRPGNSAGTTETDDEAADQRGGIYA